MIMQTLKGFRDFLPQEARKRNYVIDILRKTFESFGFEPLETPTLEYEEVLAGKYGDEGQKLMYRFKDAGDRDVAMRYDQTVPLARVVAQYQNDLPLPFKRYQVQTVWRAENTQKGRFREFLQCDIDTVGTASLFADAEVIQIAIEGLKKLGFKPQIWINDRSLLDEFLNDNQKISLDKLEKIGKEGVIAEWKEKGVENPEKLFDKIKGVQPSEKLKTIFRFLNELGYREGEHFAFTPQLARGLSYYTSTIFEMKLPDTVYQLSVGGGGRYDNLIGMFAGKDIPAVGFSFGFDRLIEAMDELDLFTKDLTTSRILVTIPGHEQGALPLNTAMELRDKGINVDLYPDPEVPLDKQLKYADKKGIPFVILFEEEKIVLKDMNSGEKSEKTVEEILNKLS